MTESALVKNTLRALELRGVWAWRANSGTLMIQGRMFKGAPAGTPDILGVINGKLFGLEAKTTKGKVSETQRVWHSRAEREGVRVGVFRTVGEALGFVETWRKAG